MGEVYRARDTKLDREVAIKVLPELFVSDPERVARFLREAKTLAPSDSSASWRPINSNPAPRRVRAFRSSSTGSTS
jgi:serine/threonine protein kinase